MKKVLLFISSFLFLFGLTGCGLEAKGDINKFSFIGDVEQIGANNYKCIVSNSVSSLNLDSLVSDNGGCNYSFIDKKTNSKVDSYVTLDEGDNEFILNVEKTSWRLNVYRYHLFTVSFDAGGEYFFNDIIVEENHIINPPIVVKNGYTCSWDYDFSKPILSSFTTHLQFTPNHYKIFLNGDGGELEQDVVDVVFDSEFNIPNPSKRGYDFLTWMDDYGQSYQSGIYSFSHDLYLTAKYSIILYTIQYNFEDIPYDGVLTYEYTVNDSVSLPNLSVKGSNFIGWQDQNSVIYNGFIPEGTIGNLVLTPCFEYTKYKVSFDSNGGFLSDENSVIDVSYNSLITEPLTPYHKTKLFDGWYLGDKKWDFANDKMPHEDIILKARYYIPDYTDINNFEYEYNSKVYIYYGIGGGKSEIKSGYLITKYIGTDSDVRIPYSINGTPIIGLADQSFMNTSIKQLYFDSNLIYFGKKSLSFCNNLVNVVFSASKYCFDSQCFYKTNNIRNIYFPNTPCFYRASSRTSSVDASLSTCTNMENIWIDNPTAWGGNAEGAAFYALKNLKNLHINSNSFSKMRRCLNDGNWISSCGVFNLYFSGSIANFLKSLGVEPLSNRYYLYISNVLIKDFTISQVDSWSDCIALSTCLNEFGTITLNDFDNPCLGWEFSNNVQCIKYTNYQSQNYDFTAEWYYDGFKPKFLFIPNNLAYFNLSLSANQSSVVIPNNINVIDNCKGFKYVFIDRNFDESLADSFGDSVVYWRGQWHFDDYGLPVSN